MHKYKIKYFDFSKHQYEVIEVNADSFNDAKKKFEEIEKEHTKVVEITQL